MKSIEKKSPNRKMLIFGSLFILLGVLAVVFTPGNYWLYANFVIGLAYVAVAFYEK